MKPINIVHIYPEEMNIYGDNGNVLVLRQRLLWRGIPAKVLNIGVGDSLPADTNLIIGGGGQDAGQSIIAEDLQAKAKDLKNLAQNGIPMLMICGMYQMFGHYFKTQDNHKIPGIGILDLNTVASDGRLIGNITDQTEWGDVIGYENHSGRTFLGDNVKSFGMTKKGQGNNGKDKTEGAVWNNVFGSYLHGPLLAKSPNFADYLLNLAITQAGNNIILSPLNDQLEALAAKTAKSRPR